MLSNCKHRARKTRIEKNKTDDYYTRNYFLAEKKKESAPDETINQLETENAPEKLEPSGYENIAKIRKSEVDKQFSDVTGSSSLGYNPHVDISTTYSTKESMKLQEDETSVFPTGVIPLTGALKTVGKLVDGIFVEHCLTLEQPHQLSALHSIRKTRYSIHIPNTTYPR